MAETIGERIRAARARITFDAEHFLQTLYPSLPQGALIALGTLDRPRFLGSVEQAVAATDGGSDIYVRVTLLAVAPRRGRGSAADSAWLPGVWAEVDVNGGPKSAGGVVQDGAPTVEAAMDLAHSVLQPTMMVRSGYGLHAYWLLQEPLDIRDAAAREQAARLVEGWQRRLRQVAAGAGIPNLDATHDLARVLRPAGSWNGKGDEPQRVVLLDDGGPRYTVEQLDAETLAPVARIVVEPEPATNGAPRKPDELLARYPVLSRLAKREGKAPGDGSESAWDWTLACEARRRVKPPITLGEAAALISHGRGGTGKGQRRDYLERTVQRAFDEVGAPDAPAAATADPAAVISRTWGLTEDPIVEGWSMGLGLEAIVFLRREDGTVVRLRRLGDLFTAARHVAQVSAALPGVVVPNLGAPTAVRCAQAIIALCGVRDHSTVEQEELEGWLATFRRDLGAILDGDLFGTRPERWRVLVAQRDFRGEQGAHSVSEKTAAVRDPDGRLWLPLDALAAHVRRDERASVEWGHLGALMAELGWEVRKVDVHDPASGREKSGARHIRGTFYGEPTE